MKLLNKPVWAEGMYLGPHNFQAQSRYFEDSLNFVVSGLWRDAYGFTGLQIDFDALRNGTLAMTAGRGLFEDGLAFDWPSSDAAPPVREFGALFSPVADHVTMYLAVPVSRPEGRNINLENGTAASARYRSNEQILPDENTGRDEKMVRIGRKNLRLVSEDELNDQLIGLPLIRIVRDGSGRFESDPGFVPPCLTFTASATLTSMLRRLLDILDDKSSSISREQEQRHGKYEAGLSARHVAQYWFLHTVNASAGTLRHFLLTKHVHPQELFREMSRLAGALCTFGLEVHPRSLPTYDHRDAGACFGALDEHIRRHLDIVVPPPAISIALLPGETCFYYGDVLDERCIGPSQWLLEIRSPMGEADLITQTPRLVKVCSGRFIDRLVKAAVPGLVLSHLSVPPARIAARVESQYFVVNRTGPCWEHIQQTRKVGVYVPTDLPRVELSLIVLIDGK
jgi:type VI secretion system protein ImpJ